MFVRRQMMMMMNTVL